MVEVLVLLSLFVLEVALLLEALHSAAGGVAAVLQRSAPERGIEKKMSVNAPLPNPSIDIGPIITAVIETKFLKPFA